MKLGEIVFYIFIILIVLSVLHRWLFSLTEEEREYDRKLKESLKDDFIYDPETGTKITLEQAESGHWISHNNFNRVKSKDEIERFYSGKEKQAEELINHIKKTGYDFKKLKDWQLSFLEKTKTLEKYDDWSYSNSFSIDNDKMFVFFPAVQINAHNRYQDDFRESQIMFWIKNEKLSGHFYFREKTAFESFTDLIRNDDEIELDGYESFAFKKSSNPIYVIKTLKLLAREKELEIEVIDGNLLIKTLKFPNMEDFLRIEKIIQNVC